MQQIVLETLIPAIVTWVAEHGTYLTKTKLLKLLYLFDIEYYRTHRHTFTGFSWKFLHLGPWAAEYDGVLNDLLAHGLLIEQRSNSSEYDAIFYRPGENMDTRRAVTTVADESILLGVLKRWGACTTGEILNHVYFQTEPMEWGVRNQPLDFSLIATERPAVYSRSSSGRSRADIRKLRAQFEQKQAAKQAREQQPFTFTPPKYDEEYFEAMDKLYTA